MATDVEESDTDDPDRPAPPKRQCTRLAQLHENSWETDKAANEKCETIEEVDTVEYDEIERHAREKLKRWQACQAAKGFVDNTINKVLENYIMAPSSYPLEDSRFRLFRGTDMEDTAVTMAIRNYGLVQSGFVSQSRAFYNNRAPGYWTNEYSDVQYYCPSNLVQNVRDTSARATTSSNSLRLNNSLDTEKHNTLNSDADKPDGSEQEEDFLERAVAEAIKKKGLSALSVDYG